MNKHVIVTAAVSLVALAGAAGWELWGPRQAAPSLFVQSDQTQEASDTPALLSPDPVSNASAGALIELQGAISGLKSNGTYDTASVAQMANQIGLSTRTKITYDGYSLSDVRTDAGTSTKRIQQYRSDLQAAEKPLLKNADFELSLLDKYLETKDQAYLDQLRAAAANYFAAASSTAAVIAPRDAASIHLNMLNAMVEFGTVLDTIADHAQDPVATVMLVNNYNQAESDLVSSFADLTSYFKRTLL